MKKEALRLQMLSGIISESVYKEKLEELGGGMSPKRIFRRAVVKKLNAIYDSVDNAELKLKLMDLMNPTIDGIVDGRYGDDIGKYPMADLLDDLDGYLKSVTQPLIDNYSSKDSIEVSDIEESLNENKQKIKISKKELAKIISEEIVRFKKKSLLENRLREIDEELKNL